MNKFTTIFLAGTATIAMTACGSGSGGGSDGSTGGSQVDPMTLKDAIIITYHTPIEVCEGDELRNQILYSLPEAKNLLIRSESNDVTCQTYGKAEEVNDTGGCYTEDIADYEPSTMEYDTSCVIGVDLDLSSQASTFNGRIDTKMNMATDTVLELL